jgi:hypothetical protein
MANRDWTALLVLAATTTVLYLPLTMMPIARDQGNMLAMGMAIEAGSAIYRDYLIFNLPGVGFVYYAALKIFRDPQLAVWGTHYVCSVLSLVCGYGLLKRCVGKPVALAGAVAFAAIWPLMWGYWQLAQKDILAVPFLLGSAWLCASISKGGRTQLRIVLAGVLAMTAVMMKIVYVPVGLLLGMGLCVRAFVVNRTERPWSAAVGDGASFTLGVALGFVPLALYLFWNGVWGEMWFSITSGAPAYGAQQRPTSTMFLTAVTDHFNRFIGWHGIVLASWGWVAFFLPFFGKPEDYSRRLWVLAPLLGVLAALIIQGRGWPYHHMPLDVFLMFGVGIGLFSSWQLPWRAARYLGKSSGLSGVLRVAGVVLPLALVAWEVVGIRQSFHSDVYTSHADAYFKGIPEERFWRVYPDLPAASAHPSQVIELARRIKAETEVSEKLVVWGMESAVHAYSGRLYLGQTPFPILFAIPQYVEHLPQWVKQQRSRFLNELAEERPRFFIVVTNDRNPVQEIPSDHLLMMFPDLYEHLKKHYRYAYTIGRFWVYVRA